MFVGMKEQGGHVLGKFCFGRDCTMVIGHWKFYGNCSDLHLGQMAKYMPVLIATFFVHTLPFRLMATLVVRRVYRRCCCKVMTAGYSWFRDSLPDGKKMYLRDSRRADKLR